VQIVLFLKSFRIYNTTTVRRVCMLRWRLGISQPIVCLDLSDTQARGELSIHASFTHHSPVTHHESAIHKSYTSLSTEYISSSKIVPCREGEGMGAGDRDHPLPQPRVSHTNKMSEL
jgi:hypothetical protein